MCDIKFNPKDLIFSLDIGTRSIIGSAGIVKDKKFHVLHEAYIEHDERAMRDGQIHDIGLVAEKVKKAVEELESKLGVELKKVSIAAAGRFLKTTCIKSDMNLDNDSEITSDIVKSLELTAIKKAESEINNGSKGKLYCVGYSVKSYYLNGYLISNLLGHKGEDIAAEVIATFLPRSVVDSLYSVMDKVGLEVVSLTLEPIAAMEAAVPSNLRLLNIALIDIGAGTSDIAISSKNSIIAYGMVPLAGDEVTEAIAQVYLTDFNTAEKIKCQCMEKEMVSYIDVLGLENEIESSEIIKVISPVVDKISNEVASKIVELNGGKAPNAIFMVGGGAHTPKMREYLSEKLNLQIQRIAVKGREAAVECVVKDNSLGSIGVTVLGIALMAIKNSGHDFINVTLNGEVISLFNAYTHTVGDLFVQSGIDPKRLIGKKGKSMRFTINGIKRVAFGELPKQPVIRINEEVATLEAEIKDGDIVEIEYAENGKDSKPMAADYIKNINTVSFYLNDEIVNIEPIVIAKDETVGIEYKITENDEVEIILPDTIGKYRKYYSYSDDVEFYKDDIKLESDYIIKEEDRIYSRKIDNNTDKVEVSDEEMEEDNKFEVNENSTSTDECENKIEEHENKTEELSEDNKRIEEDSIVNIKINGEIISLSSKKEYIFVDIFNYIKFDLSKPQGNLILTLNGKIAGYYDEIKDGDVIEVFWEKKS